MSNIMPATSGDTNPTAHDWLLNYAGDSDWRTQVDRVLAQHRAEVLAEAANPTDELARLRTRVEELETFARGCDGEGCILPHSSWCRTAREFAANNRGCTCGEPWTGSPQTHAGHCWLLSPPDDELEWHRKRVAELIARVAELEAESGSQTPEPNAVVKAGQALDAFTRGLTLADAADLRRLLGTYRTALLNWAERGTR